MRQQFLTRIFSSADKTKLDNLDQGVATTDTPTFAGAEFTGDVGVGVTSPLNRLQVSDDSGSTTPAIRTFTAGHSSEITSFGAREGLEIISYQSDPGGPYTKTSAIIANSDGTVPSELQLWAKAGGQSSPSEAIRINGNGDVLPGTTESQDLGSASKEWDNLYLQNAATVSDERRKNVIGSIDDASAFLRLIDPVWFTYTDSVITAQKREVERQVTKIVQRSQNTIEIRNGVATEVNATVDVAEPQFTEVPVFDEDGDPVMETVLVGVAENGKPVTQVRQKVHKAPIMETVLETVPEKVISHSRPHTGFIAQKIKQAMTECGYDDWAGYAYDDDEDLHMLRLMELIAFTVKGWQEMDARVAALEK